MLKSLKSLARRILKPALHRPDLALDYEMLGSAYGGWPFLREPSARGALIYSFGLGEDISFDIAAVERYGCEVHGFDPTPKSEAWIATQTLPPGFVFHPIGIADHDGEAEFFAPANEAYASFSQAPAAANAKSVTARVMRLGSIVAMLGGRSPDIVKMDIEGFEYGVVADILAGDLRPAQLFVEFHHDMYGFSKQNTLDAVAALRSAGYRIFHVAETGREYGFVLRERGPKVIPSA